MTRADDGLRLGSDGLTRCWWCGDTADYVAYHDAEWGRPISDDRTLFEKIVLEGFQSGLSWLTILRKREGFRAAFANFNIETVARFDERDVERMLGDAGIVRHRKKIESAINNAQRAADLIDAEGSLAAYVWRYEPTTDDRPAVMTRATVPNDTTASAALSKDLKKRGWSFVGPTTAYAFFQAMGLVNDHVEGCFRRPEIEAERDAFTRPAPPTGATAP